MDDDEHRDYSGVQHPTKASGWLYTRGSSIWRRDEANDSEYKWLPAAAYALAVAEANDSVVYDTEVHREVQGDKLRVKITNRDLESPAAFAKWCTKYRIKYPRGDNSGSLMLGYLEAQKPPKVELLEYFDGPPPDHGLWSPRLTHSPFHYGFKSVGEARDVLREVLKFQATETVAVAASWWAACFLKSQLLRRTSQFPILVIEAPSEAGKSTGFFKLLVQMNGNKEGSTRCTNAVVRDALGSNMAGIVWLDEFGSTDPELWDMIRLSTAGSLYKKKDNDPNQEVRTWMVNPLMLAGERIPHLGQKAIVDRFITLRIATPKNRLSWSDWTAPQWRDVKALEARYAPIGLSQLAGTYWRMAQAAAPFAFHHWADTSSRYDDKMAILRFGSIVLEGMTLEPGWIDKVEAWIGEQEDFGSENLLTMQILPKALELTGYPYRPSLHDPMYNVTSPVFVDKDGVVWYSVTWLAIWWGRYRSGHVDNRVESQAALKDQADAIGPANSQTHRPIGGEPVRYRQLPIDLGQKVVGRAQSV